MGNKKYSLVAWTEKGQIRMIPSLINELSLPYRQHIAELEDHYMEPENEIGWLLAQSGAHEDLARFFLRFNRIRDAYDELEKAATVCVYCSEELWVQGDECDFPTVPLFVRFLEMHGRCVELAGKDRFLKERYERSRLRKRYLYYTHDHRALIAELKEAGQARRAWEFGKKVS